MTYRWGGLAVLGAAGLALWLLLAGPSRVLGFDPGNLGMVLLVSTAWVSLYGISRIPGDRLEAAASPGEWRAWVGFGFTLVAVLYFLSKTSLFQQGPAWGNPDAAAVARNLVMLLVAWAVLSGVMAARWKNAVQEDERDRDIARHASGWGRGALMLLIVGLAVMLGFSPAAKLEWATHFMIANLLVFALMWGWLCEYAATAVMYWRDRH